MKPMFMGERVRQGISTHSKHYYIKRVGGISKQVDKLTG